MLANDIHSRLNPTRIGSVLKPSSIDELVAIIVRASERRLPLAIAGMRHAMGGQQFGTRADLVDMTALNKIISLDAHGGILEVESGVTWPAVVDYCWNGQKEGAKAWAIAQKQTGADALTLGGALSANVHGRGLTMGPIVRDVVSFRMITPAGGEIECSRSSNAELFKLAIGGYGLFGVIASIKLQLAPRVRLWRSVVEIDVEEVMPAFERSIGRGCLYGDFQYMTDPKSPDFLRKGVFACYEPVDADCGGAPRAHRELSRADWEKLYSQAFTDKAAAYRMYSQFYLGTEGQIYWSDRHQLSVYLEDYHAMLNGGMGFKQTASLMITELYVPRNKLVCFMNDVRKIASSLGLDIIYGTIRLIEKDKETFLAWAKEDYACVIFNLRVVHTPVGIAKAQDQFRALIDAALVHGGSYYLTYHRWARKDQVLACYPQFAGFLAAKAARDPIGLIRSDWYAHYKEMFAA